MKVFHIVCMVLMIAMMQHTCLADEQTEIIYGDGWTHYNYIDGIQAHKLAPINYLRWDGEWWPKTEMNVSSGDWPYLVEEFETSYLITRLDDSITLSKTYRTYNFQPYKIGVQLTLTPIQLNGLSTYHNVGGIDYWYITIPQSLKEVSKHLNWDNRLPIILNETGFVLNQSDNVSGEWLPNYKYQNVGGELRLYYGQTARSFGIASTEIIFDFNSYIINSSIGWANTSYSNFAYDRNTGYLILPDNVTDGLVLYHKMSGSSGITSYDMNLTSDNNGTLTNMNIGLDNGSSGWNSSGKYDNTLQFDGSDDYVDCGNDESLNLINALTIMAWIKLNGDYTSQQEIVHKLLYSSSSNNKGYGLNFGQTDNEFIFYTMRDAGGSGLTSSISLSDDNWHFVVATHDGTTKKIYFDGVLDVSQAYGSPFSTPQGLGIGSTCTGTGTFFNGSIDEVRIYNCALTNDEINQTMNNTMVTSDNVTHWHDAGSGYQTASFIVNMTGDINYTVKYGNNASGSWTQIGGYYTTNSTPSISGSKYQNTDLRITMYGNGITTPEEMEVAFVTEASAAGAAPNITSWSNNKTNNNSLDITINTSEEVNFNATANQTIATWNWYKDNVDQSHNYDNITLNWSTTGIKHVVVNVTNSNGTSSSITWNVTVVDPDPGPTPTPSPSTSVSPGHYDELDLPLILYILMISMLYLLIAFRHGVATIELSLIYLIFAFFFLLFQTITISVNYIYLTLFLLLFLISIAGITKQGAD